MKDKKGFYGIIAVELGLLAGVSAGIYSLTGFRAESLYLYEILGALMASVITTYGVYKMHDIT